MVLRSPNVDRYVALRSSNIVTSTTPDCHLLFSYFSRPKERCPRRSDWARPWWQPYPLSTGIIARHILHLCSHNAPDNAPLARVYLHHCHTAVTPNNITLALCSAVTYLSPASLGFLPSDVSAQCLRAAGANALLCASADTDVIHLLGCWRSDEMLCYLHLQAAPLMHDFSKKMLKGGTFMLVPNQLVPCF